MRVIFTIFLIISFNISFSQTSDEVRMNKEQLEKQKQQNIEDASKKMKAESEANYKKYLEEKENAKNQNVQKYSSTQKGAKAIDSNTNSTDNNQASEKKEVKDQPDFSKMTDSEKTAFEKQKQQNAEDARKKMNAESDANYKKYLEEQDNLKKQAKPKSSSTIMNEEEKE